MRVPFSLARYMYFVATGWLFATCDPKKTSRSVPIQTLYEHVEAAYPIERFSAVVLGA